MAKNTTESKIPGSKVIPSEEERRLLLEEYKLVIETQMHFNEMLLKYRSLAFTIIAGLTALAIIYLKGEITYVEKLSIFGYELNLAGLFASIILIIWFLIGCVDYCYYFRLLIGAVERSTEMEKGIKEYSPFDCGFLGMTTKINKAMPRSLAHLIVIAFYVIPFLVGFYIAIHLLIGNGTKP